MLRILQGLVLLAMVFWLQPATDLRAEPYLALQRGLTCANCHVNQTGGGKRHVESCKECGITTLYSLAELVPPGASTEPFSGELNDFISLGGDFSSGYYYRKIKKQEDYSTFLEDLGKLYLEIQPIPGFATLYFDQLVSPGPAETREAFLLIKTAANNYLKAGKFFLPFGLRIRDETAYVRTLPLYNMQTPHRGMEFGIMDDSYNLFLAVTNGTTPGPETNISKQFTGTGEMITDIARIAVSYANNRDELDMIRRSTSINGGVQFGNVGLMFEVVNVKESPQGGADLKQKASLLEMNLGIATHGNLKVGLESLDPDTELQKDEFERTNIFFESFLMPHLKMGIGTRITDSASGTLADEPNEYLTELHVFF